VFVTVTDSGGNPVGNLGAPDFRVALDMLGEQSGVSFTLPPSQSTQRVSVVFVMDYSGSVQAAALDAMREAVINFINAMVQGDVAAVVKFNGSSITVAAPFTVIDSGGAAKSALTSAVMAPFAQGSGTNLIDGLNASLNQFITPGVTLPDGPKALIAITDGLENSSTTPEGAVVDSARANGIPIFTVGVSDPRNTALLNRLPTLTGGEYISTASSAEIAAAYSRIADKLKNEYLLSVPSTITDCNDHTIFVDVTGQTVAGQTFDASATFARCTSSSPPPPPPPGGGGSGGGGGGGGGALGLELLPGLLALVVARRRRTWTIRA
jgi:VWFA-related protein